MNAIDHFVLPDDLPVPEDDGAADHLRGMRLPALALLGADGGWVDLSALPGRSVVYCYPRTADPAAGVPRGWNDIPGARGCTPQSVAYRDRYPEFSSLHVRVYGLSTQSTAYQQEAVARLQLPFSLLSDTCMAFAEALGLPDFMFDDQTLLKRLTFIVRNGFIEQVFYPVFPPDQDAENVLTWLRAHP